jgi:hypothetical protein
MRLLGSAPMSHLCDQKRRSKVAGFSDLMTLFIDLGCLNCKQTQRAFKNTLNWLKIDSVDKKFNWLECGNLTRRWNAWRWESHCVFTAGGERVKDLNRGFELQYFVLNREAIVWMGLYNVIRHDVLTVESIVSDRQVYEKKTNDYLDFRAISR